jgi:hypothetical protein
MKRSLKYPLYLFVLILVAKIGYIIVESFYNYHVLTVTTAPDLTKEVLEELNQNGHMISAMGITLLLLPFLYLLVKRVHRFIMPVLLALLIFITFNMTYEGLNVLINKVVEINKEKRHDAYYINTFKYGVLNHVFSYDSFLDHKKVLDGTLDVNDRILLTNTFLLLSADEHLLEKLKDRGQGKIAQYYMDQNLQDDYEERFSAFKDGSKKIKELWEKFNVHRDHLDQEFKKNSDASEVKKAYQEFKDGLIQKFKEYQEGVTKVILKIREETLPPKIQKIHGDLKRYFAYQTYSRAQTLYKENMQEKFGYYIEPDRWKDSNGDLTTESITAVIEEEIKKKAFGEMAHLPLGLNFKNFLHHDQVKLRISKQLKEKGLLIAYDFNYSYKEFKQSYDAMLTQKYNEGCEKFYKGVEKEIGANDLKLDMGWDQFMDSNYIRRKIKASLKDARKSRIDHVIAAYKTKDLGNFKPMVYLQEVKERVNSKMYSKEDFKRDSEAAQYGDDAIRLLYIPPFALSVSIIALLLNIITVAGMLLNLTTLSKLKQMMLKGALYAMIIALPLFSRYDSFNNELIKASLGDTEKIYLKFLGWISYYEIMNSSLHQKKAPSSIL